MASQPFYGGTHRHQLGTAHHRVPGAMLLRTLIMHEWQEKAEPTIG